jgi:hypothetical protein
MSKLSVVVIVLCDCGSKVLKSLVAFVSSIGGTFCFRC